MIFMQIDKKYHKVIKFLISGGLAATTEYVSFLFIAIGLKTPIILANIISFMLGLCVSFILNRSWVFTSKSNVHKKLVKYFVLAVANVAISTGMLFILNHDFFVYPAIAKLIVMALIAIWNYFIFSKLIFKD